MYTSYVKCLSSKLSSISYGIQSTLPPFILTAHRISQSISYKHTSFSYLTITEIHNLIMTANYIYPIDPLSLIVLKNLVHTLINSILDFISK